MPSLSDTLAQLSVNSTHIHEYAQGNIKPSGPYTTAYLHCLAVPDLIRDGTDPERRAFGFIGEGNDNVKKAEKREGPVTPLKDLAIVKGRGGEEIEIVLRTAARLVDDYQPMPRARNHIAALTEQHERQSSKIAELEKLIAELSNPAKRVPDTQPTASSSTYQPMMSIDEAIAAEEASLRAIEAYLKPHRENQAQSQPIITQSSPQTSPNKANDNNVSPIRAARPSIFAQTPGKTPVREYPHISNSLVNPSPYREGKINRFTPLKNIGTPQKRERGSIFGMRAPRSVGLAGGRSFVGQLHSAISPIKQVSPTKEVLEQGDETIRIAPEIGEPISPSRPHEEEDEELEADEDEDDGPTPQASPVKMPSPVKGPRSVHGVLIDNEGVSAAIAKIGSTYPDLIGDSSSTEEAINHLQTLSISSPDPIPSDQSSTSSALSATSSPITKEAVALSLICLIVLRSDDLVAPMNDLKETFGSFMKGRREEWAELDGGKMAWKLVGRKTARFDRSNKGWGAQGALRFVV